MGVKSSPKDVVEVSAENGIAGKKVAARSFYSQTYRGEQIWLTISQVVEVQDPLCAISQKHGKN